jgi:hypothetical protein
LFLAEIRRLNSNVHGIIMMILVEHNNNDIVHRSLCVAVQSQVTKKKTDNDIIAYHNTTNHETNMTTAATIDADTVTATAMMILMDDSSSHHHHSNYRPGRNIPNNNNNNNIRNVTVPMDMDTTQIDTTVTCLSRVVSYIVEPNLHHHCHHTDNNNRNNNNSRCPLSPCVTDVRSTLGDQHRRWWGESNEPSTTAIPTTSSAPITKQSFVPNHNKNKTKKVVHFHKDYYEILRNWNANDESDDTDYGYYVDYAAAMDPTNETTRSDVTVQVHYYNDYYENDNSEDEYADDTAALYWSQREIQKIKSNAKTDGYIYCFELATLCDQLTTLYNTNNTTPPSTTDVHNSTITNPTEVDDHTIVPFSTWVQILSEWSNSSARGLEEKVSIQSSSERKRIVLSIVQYYRNLKWQQQQQQQQHHNADFGNNKKRGGRSLYRKYKNDDIEERLRQYSQHETKRDRAFAYKLAMGDSMMMMMDDCTIRSKRS